MKFLIKKQRTHLIRACSDFITQSDFHLLNFFFFNFINTSKISFNFIVGWYQIINTPELLMRMNGIFVLNSDSLSLHIESWAFSIILVLFAFLFYSSSTFFWKKKFGYVGRNADVVVAPPFLYIDQVKSSLAPRIEISAQNSWVSKGGAFTGEIRLSDMPLMRHFNFWEPLKIYLS